MKLALKDVGMGVFFGIHNIQVKKAIDGIKPKKITTKKSQSSFSGLEYLILSDDSLFVNIGERSNVTGSAQFARLIKEKNYSEALEVAKEQVAFGAQIIDVNMDEGMLESREEMDLFLKLVATEPDISKVPIMIDSSKWEVIETGLKVIQGKSIVNSISMKEGKEEFIKIAKLCLKYGAAVIVMAFDEKGQADSLERRKEICRRSYEILTKEVNFPPEDIIFDPNVFAKGLRNEDWRALLGNPLRPLMNRALKGQYPPGSTVKPIMALAALEEAAQGIGDGVGDRHLTWLEGHVMVAAAGAALVG